MKIYIPFNSNDFNSVFTTLSISPSGYYINRRYSFRRASGTILNDHDNVLIGFEKPAFHTRKFDKENGYPILLEVNTDVFNYYIIENDNIKYFIITSTIYLFSEFRLIFRSEKELQETITKSLKSLETKYSKLAIENSVIIDDSCFITDLPKVNLSHSNNELHPAAFIDERRLNRIFGIILGSSIAYSNNTTKEIRELARLAKTLNNNVSLFLNKMENENRFEKEKIFETLSNLKTICQSIESVDEAILSKSSITLDEWSLLKESSIFNVSVYDIILEGILNVPTIDLPIILKVEKLQRILSIKSDNMDRGAYLTNVRNTFADIKYDIDKQVVLSRGKNKLSLDHVIEPRFIGNELVINIPDTLPLQEDVLLKLSLLYFIEIDNIYDVDQFFINRRAILVDLAKHFKTKIKDFEESEERRYLLELLKSFDDLRSGFNLSSTSSNVLKSLAILFTSGRDFFKFVEINEIEGVDNAIIYFSLWGSIYGAAVFPKTITEAITNDNVNVKTLITAFDNALNCYFQCHQSKEIEDSSGDIGLVKRRNSNSPGPSDFNTMAHSQTAARVLVFLQEKKKVRLSDLKSLSKSFKRNYDVEVFIEKELKDFVSVEKEARTMYAIYRGKNRGLFE